MFEIIFNRKVIYGPNSFEKIGNIINDYGKNVLIITGKNSTKKSGVLQKLVDILDKNKIKHIIFDESIPNPTVEIINRGVIAGKKNKCDCIIGIGGGSSIDTAKAVSGMITNKGSVEEYLEIGESYKKIVNNALPMIAIPTTAGTGSEVTQNAVINEPKRKLKVSIRSEKLVPEIAILDPYLISTASWEIISASAMDALTQLIESFTGKKSHPIIDVIAFDGIKKINENLLKFIKDSSNFEAGLNLQIASYFSGIALANAGLGAVHALSRPFGGMYNLAHGLVCAILLPYITEYNWKYNIKKYAKIALALGIDEKLSETELACSVSKKIFELNNILRIPADFKKFNLPENNIEKIIEDAQGSSMRNNPKDFTKEELKELLLKLI